MILISDSKATNPVAGKYWGVDLTITYGPNRLPILPVAPSLLNPTSAGVVDSGTVALLISGAAMTKYQQYTGAVVDANGNLVLTTAGYNNLQSLYFTIGGVRLGLTSLQSDFTYMMFHTD